MRGGSDNQRAGREARVRVGARARRAEARSAQRAQQDVRGVEPAKSARVRKRAAARGVALAHGARRVRALREGLRREGRRGRGHGKEWARVSDGDCDCAHACDWPQQSSRALAISISLARSLSSSRPSTS